MINNFNVCEEVKPTERFWITDENHQFVEGNAIRLVGKREYIYLSYPQIQRAYTDESRAYAALFQLRKMNEFANMNHKFTMNNEELQPKQRYIIIDQHNNFVDSSSICIAQIEEGNYQWLYHSHSYLACGAVLQYPNREYTQRILDGLNEINKIAQFDANFRIEERANVDFGVEGNNIFLIKNIDKGRKIAHRKAYRKIWKQYIN